MIITSGIRLSFRPPPSHSAGTGSGHDELSGHRQHGALLVTRQLGKPDRLGAVAQEGKRRTLDPRQGHVGGEACHVLVRISAV
jgi:hypothetical protein